MAALAAALPYISAGVGALSALSQGNNAKSVADATAARLRRQAGQEQAVSQNKAQGTILENRLVSSRAQAVLSSSGADASGPGAEKLLSDLAAEGEYRVQADLYGGNARAARLQDEANVTSYEGKIAKQASYTNAAASFADAIGRSDTALDSASSFFQRFSRRGRVTSAVNSMGDTRPIDGP